MNELTQVLLLTTLAGAAMPVGAWIASIERIRPRWLEDELRHSIIAFGGGVLLSAVALVLVPEGIKGLSIPVVCLMFALGGVAFLLLDQRLERSGSSASQLVAMLSDFLPEAMAMGAAFATGGQAGPVLALLIGLQNLPEGFNSYREMISEPGQTGRKLLILFALLVPLGPVAGAIGYFWLAKSPAAVSCVMLFAAAGILYLTFEDIAPQAQLKNKKAPALGVVLGFLAGLVGQLILGSAG